MKQLWKTLLPFASDNNGVCSVLFDTKSLVIINDFGGAVNRSFIFCNPRTDKKAHFCGIRLGETSYIMGHADDFIDEYKRILSTLPFKPEQIILLHSPVSSLTGLDTETFAKKLFSETGIASCAFETTGNQYYDVGMSMAMQFMYELHQQNKPFYPIEKNVNLLGLNALDYAGEEQRRAIVRAVEDSGYNVVCSWGTDGEEFSNCGFGSASVNILVAACAYELTERIFS